MVLLYDGSISTLFSFVGMGVPGLLFKKRLSYSSLFFFLRQESLIFRLRCSVGEPVNTEFECSVPTTSFVLFKNFFLYYSF